MDNILKESKQKPDKFRYHQIKSVCRNRTHNHVIKLGWIKIRFARNFWRK